jgi:hypothetical protein
MLAFGATFVILTLPLFLVYLGAISSQLLSVKGVLRLFTAVIMIVTTAALTSAHVYAPLRKDSEQVGIAMFFGGGCIGLFISYFGFVFPVLVGIAFLLKEWGVLNSRTVYISETEEIAPSE